VWLYLLVIALLLVAIGVQVLYVRRYSAQMTRAAKVVTGINIALLVLLLVVLALVAYARTGG